MSHRSTGPSISARFSTLDTNSLTWSVFGAQDPFDQRCVSMYRVVFDSLRV